MSHLLGEIRERGRRVVPSVPAATDAAGRTGLAVLAEAPRASAAAIIAVLGFGALVGSLAGGAGASDPGTIVVSQPAAQSAAATVAQAAGPSSAPVARTVTVTSPAPSPPATASPAPPRPTRTQPGNAEKPATPALPPIKHVFLIVLSNQRYSETFGNSASVPYLAKTLAAKGELISNYYSVAGGSLANEIALISGQGPTRQTQANCPQYQEIQPATVDESGQVSGDGCGYPEGVITVGDQLKGAHLTYKAYLETQNAADDPQVERCRPQPGSAPGDPDQPYAAWRNPFLYFAGTGKAECPKENVPLSQLDKDLKSTRTTPALSYVVPDLCDSGADTPCEQSAPPGEQPGASGMQAAEAFLKSVVPKIQKSPAYLSGGMIAITFDQAPQTGADADSSSCCGQPTYPNLATSGGTSDGSTTSTDTTPTSPPPPGTEGQGQTGCAGHDASGSTDACAQAGAAPGGGVVGLLLLSKYVKPGTVNGFDLYNHFSLMASIEDLFGLDRIGYAAAPGLPVFGPSVYTAYSG